MADRQPNLLILLCDQLQRNVLDIYGGPVPTRAWRRLADTGAVLDRFYCACPLCVPTRPSMMTGTWPHSHGSMSFGEGHDTVNPGTELLIDRLHDAGWRVAFEGIWHINRTQQDDRRDDYAHFNQRSFPYGDAARFAESQGIDPARLRGNVSTPTDGDHQHDWTFSVPVPVRWEDPIGEHPDMQAARAIADFIHRNDGSAPFAAWASFGAPHPPIVVPEPYFSMFNPDDMTPPPGFEERLSGDRPADTREHAPGWQAVADWDWPRWARAIAAYYGYAAFADHCMNVVLEALEGLEDETLIIATGDHGEMLGAHGLYQKGVLYDRACRLAAVVAGPGIPPGPRPQLASHTDLAPTVTDWFGLDGMPGAQGRSLKPMLTTPQAPGVPYQFVEFNGYILGGIHTRAAVSETYKYIWYRDGSEQLFNLVNDPDERTNLADRSAYSEIKRAHRAALAQWMQNTTDPYAPCMVSNSDQS